MGKKGRGEICGREIFQLTSRIEKSSCDNSFFAGGEEEKEEKGAPHHFQRQQQQQHRATGGETRPVIERLAG